MTKAIESEAIETGASAENTEPVREAEFAPETAERELPTDFLPPQAELHGQENAEPNTSEQNRQSISQAEIQKMQAQALAWQQELAQRPSPAAVSPTRSPPPDPRSDFLGFARWQGQEINRLNQELSAQQHRAEEEQRRQAAEAGILQEWDKALGDCRTRLPDIDAAVDFLEGARLQQLRALANIDRRFADSGFCEKQIYAELRDIIIGSFQQGKSPAEAVYGLAQAYGYGRNDAARMDKLQQAEAAARSLTSGGGKQAGDPMLLETVANLPEAEFAKWYEANKSSFRSLFGG